MYKKDAMAVALLVSILGCNGTDSTSDQRDQQGTSAAVTEVVIVATQPLITDMPDGFTPGHLRALLEKVKPDVIAIAAATNVPDPLQTAPYECSRVTQPWALEHQIPVIPVGWHEPSYVTQVQDLLRQIQDSAKAAEYRSLKKQFQQASEAMATSCDVMNSRAYHQLWREYHNNLHELAGGETPWETWNAKIVDNIRSVCREHPGQRVAIVIGGSHAYFILDQLAAEPGVSVVAADSFLPISVAELRENTDALDYLKAMRPLNFEMVTDAQLSRAARLLDHIKGVPSLIGDYKLFRAKYLMHSGDEHLAVAEFDEVASTVGESISKFDGTNRLVDGARIGAALAMNRVGENGLARSRLRVILEDASSNAAVRKYAEQLLSAIPD